MTWFSSPEIWVSMLTLTLLEVVLGIDNLIFLTIVAGRLPPRQQRIGRQVGLSLPLRLRLALLAAISWIMNLSVPIITLADYEFSGRDLILIGGSLFLVWKGTAEIHARIEGEGAAVVLMIAAAIPVVSFVNRHPTVMLALSFLLLIGMTLIADEFGVYAPEGYIYAAIGFSAAVEMLNQIASHRRKRLATAKVL